MDRRPRRLTCHEPGRKASLPERCGAAFFCTSSVRKTLLRGIQKLSRISMIRPSLPQDKVNRLIYFGLPAAQKRDITFPFPKVMSHLRPHKLPGADPTH